MVGRGELHDDIAKDKKTRKKEKGQEENVFLILGLPLGSDGHRAARKIRGKLEGSRRCVGEMPIWVVESVSTRRVAEALPRPDVLGCVQGHLFHHDVSWVDLGFWLEETPNVSVYVLEKPALEGGMEI